MNRSLIKQFFTPILSLFASFSTLICCALPALLVTLGMGATLASIISIFPWVTIISKYKIEIFITAGFMILISIILFLKEKKSPCPSDMKIANLCAKLRFINLIMLYISLIFYSFGFFFAFLVAKIF